MDVAAFEQHSSTGSVCRAGSAAAAWAGDDVTPLRHDGPMELADLHECVERLRDTDLGLIDDGSLHDQVVAIGRELARLTVVFSQQVREWEQRGIFERDGSRSPAHRLARELRSSVSDRKVDVRRARRIDLMPLTVQAVLEGRLSVDHLDLFGSVNTVERRALFERDEAMLIARCEELHFFEACKAVRYWAQLADGQLEHDRAEARASDGWSDDATPSNSGGEGSGGECSGGECSGGEGSGGAGSDEGSSEGPAGHTDGAPFPDPDEFTASQPESKLFASRGFEDVLELQGTFAPIDAAIIERELHRLAEQIRQADVAAGRTRTAAERRAAALVEMARRSGTAPADGKRPAPLFKVLIGYDRFRELCELSTGAVVSPSQLVPHLTGSMLESILFDGTTTVLGVSSQRTFRGALRSAIEARDRHCTHPSGCDVPADECHVDHIVPWAQGGPTSQFNGRLRCKVHNVIPHLRGPDTQPLPERPVTTGIALLEELRWRARLRYEDEIDRAADLATDPCDGPVDDPVDERRTWTPFTGSAPPPDPSTEPGRSN